MEGYVQGILVADKTTKSGLRYSDELVDQIMGEGVSKVFKVQLVSEEPVTLGEMITHCKVCDNFHGVNSECMQGVAP